MVCDFHEASEVKHVTSIIGFIRSVLSDLHLFGSDGEKHCK